MVDRENELKMPSRWAILALVLRATMRMRVLLKETYCQKMKPHCCLFPRDYEFEREMLVQLWMAAGFLGYGRSMEDDGNSYFDVLVNEDYILRSRTDIVTRKIKYTVNFDKVRLVNKDEMLCTIMKEKNASSGSMSEMSRHVSLACNHIDGSTCETLKRFSKLRTLLFIRDYGSLLKEVPSALFSALTSLQALDLSGSYITELPSSIGDLRWLSYLDLSFTLIEALPESIDLLQELQTLKLKGCKHLFVLPTGANKLIKLRHLDFDVLGQLSSMPRGIGALTELRTLSAFVVGKEEGCNIIELKNMNYLSGSCCISGLENVSPYDATKADLSKKEHVTELQLRWNGYKSYSDTDKHDASTVITNLSPPYFLEILQILCYPGSKFPTWIQSQHKLVSITLLRCQNKEINIFLGSLTSLKELEITQMNEVTTIDHRFRGGDRDFAAFPKLEQLVIVGMSSLETWTGVRSGDFPHLSKLSIKHCPKLTVLSFLPYLCSLKHLEISHCAMLEALPDGKLSTSLETLITYSCPSLKKSCSKEGADWEKIKHVPYIWIDLKDMHSTHENGTEDSNTTSDDDDFDYFESEDLD